MNKNLFVRKIAKWYEENRRELPWRHTNDPYRIWISEVILQQTRVSQGLPYYQRFVERYPDVVSLSRASEQEILRLWQGLGYYSRARNLHRCAKLIAGLGKFPESFEELLKLPGIGSYTAAAIASLAYREPVAVVDGNVFRVLSRIFGDHQDISTLAGKNHFFKRAQSLIPAETPDAFNQAIMEFGALQCVPKNPTCQECIFKRQCTAFANNWQDQLPVKSKKAKVKERFFYYFVIESGKKIAMKVRDGKDIWHGLYDFYLVESNRKKDPTLIVREDKMLKSLGGKIEFSHVSHVYTHLLSHQKLRACFVTLQIPPLQRLGSTAGKAKMRFFTSKEMNGLPKPVLITRYLSDRQLI